MAATLITVLALNAASTKTGEHPVFYVTLPAAVVMFCWDIGFGWYHRKETREIARKGRQEFENAKLEKAIRQEAESRRASVKQVDSNAVAAFELVSSPTHPGDAQLRSLGIFDLNAGAIDTVNNTLDGKAIISLPNQSNQHPPTPAILVSENTDDRVLAMISSRESSGSMLAANEPANHERNSTSEMSSLEEKRLSDRQGSRSPPQGMFVPASTKVVNAGRRDSCVSIKRDRGPTTLVSLAQDAFRWLQETFPTATAVIAHLPFALVPFAFCMFVLVQGLVTKGWVPVFAYGWNHWVNKTGTVGAVGGMGFLSVVLCNFAGTNIGTTILLSRVIQSWLAINHKEGHFVSQRNFWATVYSMALGVNYGAFSTAFSASLAGLLWRDILGRKHIHVRSLEFARVNLPIISIAMIVGCAVLIGEVYIVRSNAPYVPAGF
ncbi:hypothetical protein PT974_02133 [Cladobotryum mycophilum]|uniref:Phosphate transporter n=1 Tax=Cladobotryum mycophilum TaxID=491253 RepID=A0ABR0SX76_9HYPO